MVLNMIDVKLMSLHVPVDMRLIIHIKYMYIYIHVHSCVNTSNVSWIALYHMYIVDVYSVHIRSSSLHVHVIL